jgi:hypothetical protein
MVKLLERIGVATEKEVVYGMESKVLLYSCVRGK